MNKDSIILSIHPEYVKKIISGEKHFEYRRRIPKREVSYILIYETSPTKKYVAITEVLDIMCEHPDTLWDKTHYLSGISYEKYHEYFKSCNQAFAYKLGKTYHLPSNNISFPTIQSYSYIPTTFIEKLIIEYRLVPLKHLVFIAGVHGVGKTTFVEATFKSLGYPCFSCSQLIKSMNGEVPENKLVKEINQNQELLATKINTLKNEYLFFILDGHFTLLNSNKRITNIPLSLFKKITPCLIIILTDDIETIFKRLSSMTIDIKLLEIFQKAEIKRAREVAQILNIPIYLHDNMG